MVRWTPIGLGGYMHFEVTFFPEREFPYINHPRTTVALRLHGPVTYVFISINPICLQYVSFRSLFQTLVNPIILILPSD